MKNPIDLKDFQVCNLEGKCIHREMKTTFFSLEEPFKYILVEIKEWQMAS